MTEEIPTTVTATPKPISQSKTVNFNAGALTAALAFIALAFTLPQVTAIIPPAIMGAVVAVVAIINLYLRIYKTTQPIAL